MQSTHKYIPSLQDNNFILLAIVQHFDPVILPPNSAGLLKAYVLGGNDLVIDSIKRAVKFYFHHFVKHFTIDGNLSDESIKLKGNLVCSLFSSLKFQKYCSKFSRTITSVHSSDSDFSLDKVGFTLN